MKKMILLLILPLTALMAIDFIMTEQGLFVETTTTQPPTSTTVSSYLEPVNIPAYDSSNPSHLLITVANNKWTSTNLNNSSYKHFYVEPGNYLSTITLTADGIQNDRRTISLYNGNDTHPASLTDTQQANVRIDFNNADYWTLDRLSNIDDPTEPSIELSNGSSFNIINRLHMKNYYYGIMILNLCHSNTIQNSYINHNSHAGRMSDNVGIAIASAGIEGTRAFDNKIINNDIRNAGDGIQLVVSSGLIDVQYNGTIIDSNRIWVDGDVYTNGDYNTNGYNAAGEYMIAENAMDFKAGSDDPENPVIITNNIMWGFKETDPAFQIGGGSAYPMHYGVLNTKTENNIFFDTQHIGGVSGTSGASPYSISDCTFKNNIFHNVGLVNPDARSIYAMFVYKSNNVEFDNNTYVNMSSRYWHRFETSSGSMTFNNNLMININGGTSGNDGATVTGNYYYNTASKFPKTGTEFIETVPNMTDYSFNYEIFTTAPKSKTLTGVISTLSSPHYGIAGSTITND